ncbi:rhythmically expressed gene 5 protein [Condylostylus longicornis]|uniref:rhythmically expressed gene 5 protein n=1 Tax=Condylostylus longicornis TaxID=2530218 RepID=UPI00244DA6D2|nr:rhythmically expressed gene 5 protein [Condylostylus longicornis]XP_055374170.1 rhythmically expressed gene 5 protein [Condylostylus longicornis]XP_055374171.1 rhythmically expressed gene 5 protein [Condylostylus longicornis]
MASKILICLMLTLTITQLCYGSAIPMWEFLSRNEKMSHLYSIFAKLVSDYCKTSYEVRNIPVAQCKRDLLTYASDKLQEMPDTNLDLLDPYQRGANDLIWNTIMKDHPNVHPTTKRPQYNILQGSGIIGSSSSSSSNHIQTNISPTTSALSNDASIILFGNQINGYQKNPLFDGIDNSATSSLSSSSTNINGNGTFPSSSSSSSYAMEMDAAYGNYHIPNNNNNKQQQYQQQNNNNNNINNIKDSLINSSGIIASPLLSSNVNKQNNNNYQQIYQISNTEILHKPTSQNYIASALQHQQQQHQSLIETSTNYLSGPLVIRVRPDGTPVEEDKYKPLPRDDDRDFIIGNHQFIRRQKNFIVPTSEFIVYPQQQQQQQQEQEQILQQQQQQQQYQRYQQRLRRQYRNSNSFRNIHRY